MPSLSLVMIRSAKPEAALVFYRALGCEFVEEKHGNGPLHHSCEMGGTVLEIYPGEDGAAVSRKQSGATMLGFNVTDLNFVLSNLSQFGAEVLNPARQTPWGLSATVADPDGRAVNISQTN